MESADVVIAGGGIMGCALAFQLAKRDVDVILLERETLGSQSTGKCAGGVRQQFSMPANVSLQRLSVRLFENFEAETGHPADFRQLGYLFVLTLPQQVEDFRHNMEMWHSLGLSEARWVDSAEAAKMVPVLNVDDVLGCTYCPTDGIASPADVTSGYASAARRRGARLKEGVEVVGIDVGGGRVQGVRTSAGDIATRVVFNCAGAWSASIGRMAGLEIPVLPYRRHIAVTGTFPAVPRNSPMTVDFQTSLYFHPEGDGVLIGMSDRTEPPGYVTDVNWEFLEKMFEQAARRAPALASAGIKTAWAGLYETTPDHQAILGPVPELEGFWCAAGFSGHGFMQAPAAALLLAQLLLEHRSEIDISPFAFTRFGQGSLVHERNVI
ncbi:MAG: FAD-binding oxidoreductase [Chloroflexi bacterium]|nr:MAG: FAD-binding oxidoreductase [Chloroflexota bacterium]TME42805.1 MAG: FAD-binding oxidoreductase [Chloroflexota bacterium]TME53295.1 MAG: FAD-binding oxidoreductase [Chloroflexota bacterium]